MPLSSCKYALTSALLVQLFIITQAGAHTHQHQWSLAPARHSARQQKRFADENRPISETSSWKKLVTIQESGKAPVESRYYWSSSSSGPQAAKDKSQAIGETRRIVTTQTLTEDNSIDHNKPSFPLNKAAPIQEQSQPQLSSSEKVSYNISVTHSRNSIGQLFDQEATQCPNNHYANPAYGCRKCRCNDNIELTSSNNCDQITGRCLKCLYNTEGHHCEFCKTGFYGDATKKSCKECVCNKLGTDSEGSSCNRSTGQCSCLPNVEGLDCAKCKPGFYNLASGKGCQPCKCDQSGSSSRNCNQFDGRCECRNGYAGDKCNECPMGQFEDPKTRCQNCNCHRDGSLDQNCDSKSGKCRCRTGIGGDRCDRCARGFHGRFPNCEPCNECFGPLDLMIADLKNRTQALLDRVKLLLEIGTVGAHGEIFREIQDNLSKIKNILDGEKLTEAAISDLERQIKQLDDLIKSLESTLLKNENEASAISNKTNAILEALNDYNKVYDSIIISINMLRENAIQFKEANVDEAYKNILDARNRSREAEKSLMGLSPSLLEQIRNIERTFSSTSSRYNSSSLQNEAILAGLARQIFELENSIPGINQLVCASASTVNNCDQLCGGALCNKCGGLSCAEGATTKAGNALNLAKQAIDLLNQKFNQSKLDLDALNEAKNRSEEALKQARLVLADCELQKSKFDKIGNELDGIMDGVDKFFLMDGAKPEEVRTLGGDCLALSISLRPEQILDLARKINETILNLTNIDKILQATADDLNTAEELHKQADRAKEAADNILDTVEQVLNMLRLAAIEQAKAAAAIAAAAADIEGAQRDILEIASETEFLTKLISELSDAIKRLRDRLDELRKKYAQNELYITQARVATEQAGKLADQAEKDTDELADKVALAEEKLKNKAQQNGEMKDRADRLRTGAQELAADILARLDQLRELDDIFGDYVSRVKSYQDIVDDLHRQMNQYIKDIDQKAQYYRDCQG